MSARNSHAAKAARRAEREARRPATPGVDRARVAEAVHEAVCLVTGSDGFGQCMMYAQAGALTASVITRRDYVLQAGSAVIFTGDVDQDGAELALQVDPAGGELNGQPGGRANNEFHCWFVQRPAGPPGASVKATPDDEMADFSLRHHQRHVTAAGMPWKREPLPGFWWGPMSGLTALRVIYSADAGTMNLMYHKLLPALGDAPYDASVIALRLLGRISEQTAAAKLSANGMTRWTMRSTGWDSAEVPGGGVLWTRP